MSKKQHEIRISSVPQEIHTQANNISDYYGVAFAKLIMPEVLIAIKKFPKEAREFNRDKLHK